MYDHSFGGHGREMRKKTKNLSVCPIDKQYITILHISYLSKSLCLLYYVFCTHIIRTASRLAHVGLMWGHRLSTVPVRFLKLSRGHFTSKGAASMRNEHWSDGKQVLGRGMPAA